jgi:hypothetical protein
MTLRHPVGDPYPSSTLFRDNDSRRTTMNGSTSPARPGLCPSSVRVQNRIGLKRAGSESQTLLIFRIVFPSEAPYLELRIRAARRGGSSPPSRIISAGTMRCSGAQRIYRRRPNFEPDPLRGKPFCDLDSHSPSGPCMRTKFILILRPLIILSMFALSACFEEEYTGGPKGGYAPGYGYAHPGYGYGLPGPLARIWL